MQASVGRERSEISQTLGKRMWSLYAFRPVGCKKNSQNDLNPDGNDCPLKKPYWISSWTDNTGSILIKYKYTVCSGVLLIIWWGSPHMPPTWLLLCLCGAESNWPSRSKVAWPVSHAPMLAKKEVFSNLIRSHKSLFSVLSVLIALGLLMSRPFNVPP